MTVSAFRKNPTFKPKLKPENINKQSGEPLQHLYRVWEVYIHINPKQDGRFSMLFNKKADAEAICSWREERKNWRMKILGHEYKVRERKVNSGIRHAQTISK